MCKTMTRIALFGTTISVFVLSFCLLFVSQIIQFLYINSIIIIYTHFACNTVCSNQCILNRALHKGFHFNDSTVMHYLPACYTYQKDGICTTQKHC